LDKWTILKAITIITLSVLIKQKNLVNKKRVLIFSNGLCFFAWLRSFKRPCLNISLLKIKGICVKTDAFDLFIPVHKTVNLFLPTAFTCAFRRYTQRKAR